ncbi:MAG TPA: hypothetical protein ENJ82_03150 [Bacteroidetes bacterium]|nr:hypothetical protein [Bacteroidota bacterium]
MLRHRFYAFIFPTVFLLLGTATSPLNHEMTSPEFEASTETISVYLQNSCFRDVTFQVKYDGKKSSGTIHKKDKKRLNLQVGGKIFIDGELYMEIEDSDNGETYIVCR